MNYSLTGALNTMSSCVVIDMGESVNLLSDRTKALNKINVPLNGMPQLNRALQFMFNILIVW